MTSLGFGLRPQAVLGFQAALRGEAGVPRRHDKIFGFGRQKYHRLASSPWKTGPRVVKIDTE